MERRKLWNSEKSLEGVQSTELTTAENNCSPKRRSVSESFALIRTPEFWRTGRPWRRKRSKSSDHIQQQKDSDCDHDSDHDSSCERTYQDYFKQSSPSPHRKPSRRNVLRPTRLIWPGQRVFQRRGKRDAPPLISPSGQQQYSMLIPAEHPYKILWDIMTVLISCFYAYATHTSIRDRKFGWQHSSFFIFSEIWFSIDILLNFAAERKISSQVILREPRKVWARYLTTWFAVDLLSLVPWEALYVQPIIEQQNRRSIWKKTLFRSRAVLRFCRRLGGRHFKLFGQVARHSKLHAGVGALRLIRLLVKYVPKYILFFRNMKAIVAVRALRQVHWFRKVSRHNPLLLFWKQRRRRGGPLKDDAETSSIVSDCDNDEDLDGMSYWDESMSEEERCARLRTLVRVVGYDAKFVASSSNNKPVVLEENGWTEDDEFVSSSSDGRCTFQFDGPWCQGAARNVISLVGYIIAMILMCKRQRSTANVEGFRYIFVLVLRLVTSPKCAFYLLFVMDCTPLQVGCCGIFTKYFEGNSQWDVSAWHLPAKIDNRCQNVSDDDVMVVC